MVFICELPYPLYNDMILRQYHERKKEKQQYEERLKEQEAKQKKMEARLKRMHGRKHSR